jgi:hypothetical protein
VELARGTAILALAGLLGPLRNVFHRARTDTPRNTEPGQGIENVLDVRLANPSSVGIVDAKQDFGPIFTRKTRR